MRELPLEEPPSVRLNVLFLPNGRWCLSSQPAGSGSQPWNHPRRSPATRPSSAASPPYTNGARSSSYGSGSRAPGRGERRQLACHLPAHASPARAGPDSAEDSLPLTGLWRISRMVTTGLRPRYRALWPKGPVGRPPEWALWHTGTDRRSRGAPWPAPDGPESGWWCLWGT